MLNQGTASAENPAKAAPLVEPFLIPRPTKVAVRSHLTQWQEDHGGPTDETLSAFGKHPLQHVIQNRLSKLNTSSGAAAHDSTGSKEWGTMHESEMEDMITIGLFMKPGDVVELAQPGREPVLAVFVQQFNNTSQFFSVNGRWAHSIIARVAFAITGCIDPALIEPLVPYLPTDPFAASSKGEIQVPGHIATPVTNILERMTHEAEHIYRTNASVLDTAYSSLADQKRTRMMTLGQITKTLLAKNDPNWKPSPAALLAVRKALNHNEFRFKTDRRSHRLTNVFSIRPKDDVHVVETVHEWIREYSEYQAMSANTTSNSQKPSTGATNIIDFLSKAQRLIALSRKDRDPNIGGVGPSKAGMSTSTKRKGIQFVWEEPFTNTDKQIIQFLQAWVLTSQFVNNHGLVSACMSLIRATGYYGEGAVHHAEAMGLEVLEIKDSTGALFLQEIGVITPFENRTIYDEQLMLPTVKLSRNLELLSAKAEHTRRNPDFQDSMEGLRRDWGSTTIYCIDDLGAQEIDDGISVERVQGAASEFWIHVHVANPTAFFDKTHTLSGLAAHMTETVYLPERSYSMLPSWAVQGHFSLDRDRALLTFSSRVDTDGNVLETKIQPGIAREIVQLTPSEVAMLLGHKSTAEVRTFTVGGQIPDGDQGRKQPALSAAQLQDLQDLNIVAQGLWNKRKRAGGVYFDSRSTRVSVFESPSRKGLTWNPPSTDRSRRVKGDPIIKVTNSVLQEFIHFNYTPARIVEEIMLLACSSAALWCTERKLPVMYRGTIDIPSSDDTASSKEILTNMVHPQLEKSGKISHNVALHYMESLGRAITHFAIVPHNLLGLPGFVRVTSPLRRFGDMIAHWQIEAALRYEARHGKKFDAQSSSSVREQLPFSQRQLSDSIVTLSPRQGLIRAASSASSSFWGISALHRALFYKEAWLPDTFRCVVIDSDASKTPFSKSKGASGILLDYGYNVIIPESEDLKLGDELDVRIERVDLFYRLITVKPLRLLHRDDDLP
ncbi:hypothetical protein DE146DRAFT_629753 [Phaeosphaeria sp. MPI-PUGE-AT-0046c]|nr:hypothetical protein DE146DRAFT_629753 [Phaeosphaeria sp. MPI-PUGE-AT-0046c]